MYIGIHTYIYTYISSSHLQIFPCVRTKSYNVLACISTDLRAQKITQTLAHAEVYT